MQATQKSSGILHLGAHLGQEAPIYAQQQKNVIWVEAQPEIFEQLATKLLNFPNQIAFCALLGDLDGKEATFNIANFYNGVSSSIYNFGPYANGAETLWPELGLSMVKKLTLPMIRLDSLLKKNQVDASNYDFWILDLQGAELLALHGAGTDIGKCNAIYSEVSTVEVYQGGVLWSELKSFLQTNGFIPLWEPELPHDDVLFVKKSYSLSILNDDFNLIRSGRFNIKNILKRVRRWIK